MKDKSEMREQMAQLVADARKELDSITPETDEGRAKEIEARFDAIMAKYNSAEARFKRESDLSDAEQRAVESRRPKQDDAESTGVRADYSKVFGKMIRYGISELDADERSVLMTGASAIEGRAQTSTTGSSGGFTVPQGFSGELDKQMAIWGPMWDETVTRVLKTSSGNNLPWPTVNDTANTGRIKAQNAAADDDGTDDVVFGSKSFDAYVYDTGIVRIPLELMMDSAFNVEALMTELFAERLGRLANQVLTTGTGSSQPNGVVTASAAGKTAASATAFTADELIDLLHSVDAAYRASPKAAWMFNDTVLASIRKLKDGQGNYLWQMGDVRSGEPDKFLGKPFFVNQAMANPATTTKPIIFGDFSRYVVRKVGDYQVITLRERYAENLQVGMMAYKRFDGEILNSAAIKHLVMA